MLSIFAIVAAAGVLAHAMSAWGMRHFWARGCMGGRWKDQFPTAAADDIRAFLDVFVDSFGLPSRHRLSLSPDDRVQAIYDAIYPLKGMPDGLEFEMLAGELAKRYCLDAERVDWEQVKLGELFEMTRGTSLQPSNH